MAKLSPILAALLFFVPLVIRAQAPPSSGPDGVTATSWTLPAVRATRWTAWMARTRTVSSHHRSRTAPAHRFRVGCQPKWWTVKVIGKGGPAHHQHQNM